MLQMNLVNKYMFVVALFLAVFFAAGTEAAEIDCLSCHGELAKGKSVHAAVQMGCTGCHAGIDASAIPHKKTNKFPRGLSAEQPDLCYTCHDKKMFAGRFIHAPVGIGMCTDCHSPHRSDKEKLLLKDIPQLCYKCHESKEFTKKEVHMPVSGGMCMGCHKPHASDEGTLLKKDLVALCFECHLSVRKIPHAVAGFSDAGHPLGLPKKGKKTVEDPARPGKRFHCTSCHTPHSSSSMKLFRYEAGSPMELCLYCHKM